MPPLTCVVFFLFEGDRVEEATAKELQDHPGTQARGHAAARRGDIVLDLSSYKLLLQAFGMWWPFSLRGSFNSQEQVGRGHLVMIEALFERDSFAFPVE